MFHRPVPNRHLHPRLSADDAPDIDKGAEAIVNYVLTFDSELRKLMAPVGNSSLPVGRADALISTDAAIAKQLGIQYAC